MRRYQYSKNAVHRIMPTPMLSRLKILDATPQFLRRYALNDKQSILAILRYNRLIDAFSGLTCYSLQSNVQTSVPRMGKTETDEIYIGLNHQLRQYVIPIHAKGKGERIKTSRIEQDMAVCQAKFPSLICRPLAAQFMENDLIALFEFVRNEGIIEIKDEKHYRIVPNEMLSDEGIKGYGHKK